MPTPAIEFAEVSYAVQSRTLIDKVSLALEQGTTTALLGRSGSGKTTLLRMVNALVTPTAGEIRIAGVPNHLRNLTDLRRTIGYCIQETGLFPHMTVERNAALALEIAGPEPGQTKQTFRNRAAEVLALTGLDPALATRYPWQLSGGQRQRVGLARALAHDPEILLMDEPFGALDPITRAEIQTTLRALLQKLNKTVLLVTHDLDEALYLAHRVIFLEAGEVVADLNSAEVLTSPNAHVQTYVRAVHRGTPA
ncbi:ATP-binding cassette domain-containing protein [Granulicella tundricola]|uniref:ABC transporter related protein n=1 Tax=Granulicella tundricola (strain ATCC BAA-1859 / DSM 23138 / MP5ACTX9) TaxID=1198114 RepID=E8X368_GRATM|nr:ATP-binding cassette domain-containing protein [Granulicella tundricola]ADW69292.1 ABC transporter related protein [Granulicella tundricola MP5ACTX9]